MPVLKTSKLSLHFLFIFVAVHITHPKTQRLIDRFDIYNAKGDNNDKYKSGNVGGSNDDFDHNKVGKWNDHQAQIPLVTPSSKLKICDSPLINGRVRTTCSNKGLEKVPHAIPPETTILHLESNRLTRLSARAFIELSSLQSLFLNNNAISEVDVATFEGLINLSELDLSYNKLKKTPSSIFRDFTHLQVLKLSGNRLESLPNKTFEHLPKLLKLELNDCGIRRIEIDSFAGLDQLQYLQLAKNKLFSVDQSAFVGIRRTGVLRLLHLYGNPWRCDCHLRWLHEWVEEGLITYDSDASRDQATACRSPAPLARKRWTALHSVQFACHPRLLSAKERTLVVNQYESLNFSCSIFLDPPSSLIWFKEERPISRGAIDYYITSSDDDDDDDKNRGGVESSTLTIREAGAPHSGTYRCFAANSAGKAEMIVNVVVKVRDRVSTASKMERHGTTVVICVSVGILLVLFLILFCVRLSHKSDWSANATCRCPINVDALDARDAVTGKRIIANRGCEGLIYDGQFKYSRKLVSSSAHGSKSTFHLCDKKQKGGGGKSSSKNIGESSHLHPLGAKTLPRHFRVRGSIDSGAFCFDYESCQTDSSQHTQQSATLNNNYKRELPLDDQFFASHLEAPLTIHSSSLVPSALQPPIFIQRSSPISIPLVVTSQSPPVANHVFATGSRGTKRQQQQQTDVRDVVRDTRASNASNLASNVHFHEMNYSSNPTAFRVDHRNNAILPLKYTKDVAVGNYDEFLNPKFATMMEVGKKQRMRDKGFSTMNPKTVAGTKQVRLQIGAEAVEPTNEAKRKKQSRNRSTQVPTPTEDDSFFPGEYLKEKEKEKFTKSVWE